MPDQTLTRDRFTASRSLRVRLPLTISALIAISLLLFLFLSRAQIDAALLRTGQTRAQSVADQLATMLAQQMQQRLRDVQKVADDPIVVAYLEHPESGDADAVRTRLATLTTASEPPVELWDNSGHLLIVVEGAGKRAANTPAALRAERPTAAGVGSFAQQNGVASWATTAAVTESDGGALRPAPLGFVVTRRVLNGNPAQSDAIAKLIGAGALLRLGEPGGVWTDLSRVVPAPVGNLKAGVVPDITDAGGSQYLGGAASVGGTPWLVVVEYPKAAIVAPAWAFLRRMLVIAALLVLLAAVVTQYVSGRITSPLGTMTRIAEAIANGESDERVASSRRDELGRLAIAFNTMADRVQMHRHELESRVQARTRDVTALNAQLEHRVAELDALTHELEAFSYSVSHDLRAPLRHIMGFAALLERSAGSSLDDESRRYLTTIATSASRLGRLIDDLLVFSRMGRAEMLQTSVDMEALVREARSEVTVQNGGRAIEWTIHPIPPVEGDRSMLRLVMVNLLSNAVKYTSTRERATIEIGATAQDRDVVIYVRDNGVGFDMQYASRLFGVFQRLHASDEFEGTGIGLANVRRIVNRHRGRAWAEAAVDQGATFYVSLPVFAGAPDPAEQNLLTSAG